MSDLQIELLVFDDCPHAEPARALLREVTAQLCPAAEVQEINVETPQHAARVGFLGSPSIRVQGTDLQGRPAPAAPSLCCRMYGSSGVPPRWMVEAAILRALAPRSYLFLCVANSARSQMAEGIARTLAPPAVGVASAGSKPSQVRPEAIAVLAELGIDISTYRSTSVNEVDPDSVEAVITLCAEEVCPVFLGNAHQVHWGLADPAATEGDDQHRLAAFRQVRDELRQRLARLFGQDNVDQDNVGGTEG